jgi:hypothetical protein
LVNTGQPPGHHGVVWLRKIINRFTKNCVMKFLSLQPFVPSGNNFQASKDFFIALGFNLAWDMGDYAGFENNNCRFILQNYDKKEFAENFMLSVGVPDVDAFRAEVIEKQLPEKFGICIGNVTGQAYGREVNIIDIAGVCWHFVQQ